MTSNAPRRVRDPERTREALLAAAEGLFAARGFAGTRTDDIARASGVNKAMINYHFGGKQGLYAAVLAQNLEPFLARLNQLREDPAPAPERLTAFIRGFGDLHLGNPRLSVMILREILGGGHHLDEEMLPRFLQVFTTLGDILEQGRTEGTLREAPLIHAHLTIIGGLVFFFSTRRFRERIAGESDMPRVDPDPEEFVAFFEHFIPQALAPVGSSRKKSSSRARRKSR